MNRLKRLLSGAKNIRRETSNCTKRYTEGVKIDAKRMNESYGRFAWIYDLDGNKIELWQPLPAKP